MNPSAYPLEQIAARVGTPFYLYDAALLRDSLRRMAGLAEGAGGNVAIRYAMKANSARRVLQLAREAGLWIDAVSGNEVLRAARAGFPLGADPPVILLTSDVYRDNALEVILRHGVMPNVGSPGQIRQLAQAGYRGPIAMRINPGFGHGHVQACDTGGPSSKHGIWHEDPILVASRKLAADSGLPIVALHAHIGTGPNPREFDGNVRRLVDFFARLLPLFPDAVAVNFGGGIPHPYRPDESAYDLAWLEPVLREAVTRFASVRGRPVRVEIEPGRHGVAGMALLVCRVCDVKETRSNEKGEGHRFVMVDAGFCDLVRPAMYGSYHHISIVGQGSRRAPEPLVVAGPLCESGDVFTRDAHELLDPRLLPCPDPGDLLVLHDAGAYGAAMSSNYVSQGRVPQVLWDNGRATRISRRETVEDLVATECDEALPV
ncbi:MAG: diaminopimelate decarboxylase [Deltaproteobacteria bacterium]|nr:diaminopimelate decarboxylase [Deltaproteobacteria bacterium]